ncbi:MAG: phosphoribosylanthranilate isomerase [Candidatus Magasanikbacteria bacterium]|nr:phosphoribosylanthranilate isomerase [Candidatus Magasanikbacteria bacterium]
MNPKIKICGITNIEDARQIALLGVVYLGFIIDVPLSPRSNTIDTASKIIFELKKEFSKIKVVGVFVNKSIEDILVAVDLCKFDVLQLHGDETLEYCQKLKQHTNLEIWKAVIIKNIEDVEYAQTYVTKVDKILYDSGKGSGTQIDFELLKNVDVDILAGGLGVENILDAIKTVNPGIVDVNSGVELIPGKKDVRLVKKLLSIVY